MVTKITSKQRNINHDGGYCTSSAQINASPDVYHDAWDIGGEGWLVIYRKTSLIDGQRVQIDGVAYRTRTKSSCG